MVNASIITIGDELLIGQVIDTNSAFIAQQMNLAGFLVIRRVAVGDNYDAITTALDEEKKHADIILITGGLGPTADDITKPLLCSYFGGKMIVDEISLANVKHLFENIFKRPFTERNKRQAEVPDVCTVIQNKKGTAPGMLFKQTVNDVEKIFVSMPGVPFEMMAMMTDNVIPYLKQKFTTTHIVHRTLLTSGVGESMLADMIIDFENNLPKNIKLAYLPSYGMVRLRLTATGENASEVNESIEKQFAELKVLTEEFLVTDVDETMEKTVGKLLLRNGKTISTAESCTGGYIAHLLTAMAGSSAFYKGSVVSYSNEVKENMLHVKKTTIAAVGAVSEEVVKEMASGALKNIATDYTIAVSGIMGPDGGVPDKPVGTVWICVGNIEKLVTHRFSFRFDRERNIRLTALNALNMLRKFTLENN